MVLIEGFSFTILIFVILYQAWLSIERQKEWDKERNGLLDRIMSRNYEVYVNAEVIKEQSKQPFQPAYEEEHGIPVV